MKNALPHHGKNHCHPIPTLTPTLTRTLTLTLGELNFQKILVRGDAAQAESMGCVSWSSVIAAGKAKGTTPKIKMGADENCMIM